MAEASRVRAAQLDGEILQFLAQSRGDGQRIRAPGEVAPRPFRLDAGAFRGREARAELVGVALGRRHFEHHVAHALARGLEPRHRARHRAG
jgi:hypothetical protein